MLRPTKRWALFLPLLLVAGAIATSVWAGAPSWLRPHRLDSAGQAVAPASDRPGAAKADRLDEPIDLAAHSVGKRGSQAPLAQGLGTSGALLAFEQTQHGPFDDIIFVSARRWELDPFLLKALLANESKLDLVGVGKRRYARRRGRRRTISGGAVGIAQFTLSGIEAVNRIRSRRRRHGETVSLFDARRARLPQEAIPAAAELLASLIDRYGRDGGITAYNSGARLGQLVHKLGFWRARRTGRLRRIAGIMLQGHRFLPNVLRRANWFRAQAGLQPVPPPDAHRPGSRRLADPGYASSYPRPTRRPGPEQIAALVPPPR